MKCNEIHNGLDKKELRDFYGKGVHTYALTVEYHQKQIEKLKKELDEQKTLLKEAAAREYFNNEIINQGWTYADVSDEVDDYTFENYHHFVGTEEDYNEFIENNQKE